VPSQGTHNNWIENRIRPVAIGRSNWLFAGSLRGGLRMTTQVDRRCRRVLTAMSTMMTGDVEKF
jgi:hypothetical protein